MFLTYQDGSQIPDRLHEFYSRAFEALYYRHDTHKGGRYVRKLHCGLHKDDFLRALSATCAMTYFDGDTALAEDDLRRRIRNATEIENVKADPTALLNDFIESLCVMQRDGSEISFTHRSFQEYFTAKFIIGSEVLDTFGLINQLIARQGFDNVVKMIGEMNKEYIEKKWVLRWIDLFEKKVRDLDVQKRIGEYIRIVRYSGVMFFDGSIPKAYLTGWGADGGAIATIVHSLYSSEYGASPHYYTTDIKAHNKDIENLGRYVVKRDGITAKKRRELAGKPFVFSISDKDSEFLQGTEVQKRLAKQKDFILELKTTIEARHQTKGVSFLSHIRRQS